MAKNKNNPIAVLKRILCMALVSALLVGSSAINFAASAAEGNPDDESVGAIIVANHDFAPYFGQTVYLKPDTQYTFSYKYSTDIADDAIMRYYSQGNKEGTGFPDKSGPVYDTYYNMVTYTFTTVSLDTPDVILDDSKQLIKSYIGIRVWNQDKYDFYDFVFADFRLLENGTGTNCFADPTFDSMQKEAGDEAAAWGAIDRSSQGWVAQLCYPRYYIDGVNPHRSDFVSTPKDEVVKCETNWKYLLQKVWLEPATKYVFSYYYSDKKAGGFVYLLNTGGTNQADPNFKTYYDPIWKKVYHEFTTVNTDNTDAIVENGKVQALIGICSGENNAGSYFAGFDLYKADDASKTNLLRDTKFRSIGSFTDGQTWGTPWGSTTAKYGTYPGQSYDGGYKRADYQADLSNDAFKIVNEISIGSITNGQVTASQTELKVGDEVTFTVTPDAGYELLELTVSGKPVPCIDGVYRFKVSEYYLDPSAGGKVNVSATFIEKNTIPSITISSETWSRAIAQKLWLEPNTAYIFSYHYSSAPASDVRVGYTDKSGAKLNIDIGAANIQPIEPDSTEYHTESYAFLTPGTDAPNVVVGEGQNKGLVECAVGLFFGEKNAPSASGEHLFGGLTCYKMGDPNKTNLFVNRDFSGLSSEHIWTKYWETYYSTSAKLYSVCTTYDADSATDGRQHPSADLFKNTVISGDCNGDNDVNILDMIRLKKYIADNATKIVLVNADMTGDNTLNSKDLVELKKLLLGINK